TIVSLEQSKDIYGTYIDKNLCNWLVSNYDILSKTNLYSQNGLEKL
ncbi:MAG: hypothetical protein UR68_C0020G0001, partial [Candidatus Roizmanbacteria bacterium GW2011_GWA2_35_19]